MGKSIEYSKVSLTTLVRIKNGFNYIFRCSIAYKNYIFIILTQLLSCHAFLFANDTTLCNCANKCSFECVIYSVLLGTHIIYIYIMPVQTCCWDGPTKDIENIIFYSPCIKTQIFLTDPRKITRIFTILRNVILIQKK
jgi:hypothetical protein